MPVWPKSFHSLGANLATARTEWQLRHGGSNGVARQQRVFASLTARLGKTAQWRPLGLASSLSYSTFQTQVPLCTYEQLLPAIERMKRGEPNVLWPGACSLFALSSGTTNGTRKCLPATEDLLTHFRRAGREALLYYAVRTRRAAVFRGRHLWLGGTAEAQPIKSGQSTAYVAELSALAALNLPAWAVRHLYEPGTEVAGIADWDARLQAIARRTCDRDISMIAGIPNWVTVLAAIVRDACVSGGRRSEHLQALWPNLECLVHTGIPITPFVSALRAILGPTVAFHELYVAAEGFIAAQDDVAAKGLRLMTDAGLFFEFIPMANFDPGRLPQLGAKAVPLEGVKTGIDYALVLTTPGGLVRYVLGDVVRFTSTAPPRIVYVGSTTLRLHAYGENTTERDVTEALSKVCERNNWTIVNFHVAPLHGNGTLGASGQHEWWIELKPGTVATPRGPVIAQDLDAELQQSNADYRALRKAGSLAMPVVRLVMPGVFEHWLRYEGKWGGQHKLPRCRSDRVIAEPLAQLTHFAQD